MVEAFTGEDVEIVIRDSLTSIDESSEIWSQMTSGTEGSDYYLIEGILSDSTLEIPEVSSAEKALLGTDANGQQNRVTYFKPAGNVTLSGTIVLLKEDKAKLEALMTYKYGTPADVATGTYKRWSLGAQEEANVAVAVRLMSDDGSIEYVYLLNEATITQLGGFKATAEDVVSSDVKFVTSATVAKFESKV